MKASKLNIGNWVLCNGLRTVIDESLMISIIQKDIQFTIEPIPLTEEWLLKFGFISNPYKDTYEKKYVVINCDKTKGFLDLWFHSFPVEIKYVHQLQNLYYSLTGEELSYE